MKTETFFRIPLFSARASTLFFLSSNIGDPLSITPFRYDFKSQTLPLFETSSSHAEIGDRSVDYLGRS